MHLNAHYGSTQARDHVKVTQAIARLLAQQLLEKPRVPPAGKQTGIPSRRFIAGLGHRGQRRWANPANRELQGRLGDESHRQIEAFYAII